MNLRANIDLNSELRNITLLNIAVSKEAGSVRLGIRDRPGDSTSSLLLGGDDNEGWIVEAVTLEHLLTQYAPTGPLFVKIDIEGYEFFIIDDILDAIESRKAVVYLSIHSHYFGVQAAARVKGRSPLHKLMRSTLKRTSGRVAGYRWSKRLANAVDARARVYDERGRQFRLKDQLWRVLVGKNLVTSGAVVLRAR